MQKRIVIKSSLAAGVAALLVSSAPAWALVRPSDISTEDSGGSSQAASDVAQGKLDEAKLKVCQKHQTTVENIMGRISDRGQKRLDVYSNIATKVEAFYTKKGKTVSDYDSLVADVNAKKDAAQQAVLKLKNDKADFSCSVDNPKGVAQSFKDDLKLEIAALHAYQQSIKSLITAVKSAQSSSASTSNGGGQ